MNKNITARNSDDDEDNFFPMMQNQHLQFFEKSINVTQITVPIDEPVREAKYYRGVAERVANAGMHDEVKFVINSPGGRLDGLVAILDAIGQAQCHTIAHISGEAHSAASILALNCDEVIVSPYASMLVHFVSFGSVGKAFDVVSHVTHTVDFSVSLFRDTYEGFLTEEEITQCVQGKEFWFHAEEIGKRLEAKSEFKQKQQEALEAELQAELEKETKPARKSRKKVNPESTEG